MTAPATTKTRKADRTRAQILDTAIELFKERGYDETTMRLIAEKAGVSLGNAYYYFQSKEHLIQFLYKHMQEEQLEAYKLVLQAERNIKERLQGVLLANLTLLEPYHNLCVTLFKNAADPASPLNPFSKESEPIRVRCVEFYKELIETSRENIPDDLKKELPYLFWLYQMGVNLYWMHDRSLGRVKTHNLVARSTELVSMLIKLVSSPVMIPIRKQLFKLIAGLTGTSDEESG
jgi:Transcriptional regulator